MRLRLLGAEALRKSLPMAATIEAMKSAFAAFSDGSAVVPQRLAVDVEEHGAVSLIKPALLPGRGLGAKLVSVFPRNANRGKPVITGLVILLDPATGEPMGLCDGTFLTAWRTGAASGAATDLLARPEAEIAAVIGCGVQGRTQAIAVAAVRRLRELRVYDVDAERAGRLAADLEGLVGVETTVAQDAETAVRGADVVCTATTSKSPVINGRWLKEGVLVNGVGSFTPAMREIDEATLRRARIVVDSREAAMKEAGELIRAVETGATDVGRWTELGEIVSGRSPSRTGDREIMVFKSVGLAAQDIAAAALAFERAEELGLLTEVELV